MENLRPPPTPSLATQSPSETEPILAAGSPSKSPKSEGGTALSESPLDRIRCVTESDEENRRIFRERFVRYEKLRQELGEARAMDALLERETEREGRQMGPFIAHRPLAQALELGVPLFARMGMRMSVVDASNGDRDAALEIQRACPYTEAAREFGVDRPCRITCEVDARAVTRAFPGMDTRLISSQADGDALCIFKHERPRSAIGVPAQRGPGITT